MPIRVVPNAFSIMGNVDDTVIMVKEMRIKFPKNFIGLAGVSAGSGMYIIKNPTGQGNRDCIEVGYRPKSPHYDDNKVNTKSECSVCLTKRIVETLSGIPSLFAEYISTHWAELRTESNAF